MCFQLVTEADVDNEYKVEHELTWLRDNHSKSAGSDTTITVCLFVCFVRAPLLVVLSITDMADVERCGKH